MYSSSTSYHDPYTYYEPLARSTVVASPVRTISTTVTPNPVPITQASHDIDTLGDSIVTYGVDEFGKPIKIISTGILYAPEIQTFTERVAPEEATTHTQVSRSYANPYAEQFHTTTTTEVTSPGRYVKSTTYSPSRVAPIHHEFSDIDLPVTNRTSTTTTRSIPIPHTTVTNVYNEEAILPVRRSIVTTSPARRVTITHPDAPIVRSTLVQSPLRRVTTSYNPVASPVRQTVITRSPVRQTVIAGSPVRETVVTRSPLRHSIISHPGYGHATSTYYSPDRTTTIVNDIDVKSRVDMMLEHTRARLGTSRVFSETYF